MLINGHILSSNGKKKETKKINYCLYNYFFVKNGISCMRIFLAKMFGFLSAMAATSLAIKVIMGVATDKNVVGLGILFVMFGFLWLVSKPKS